MKRFGIPAALLALEYLALSLLVDFPTSGPALALVGGARMAVPAVLGAGTAGLLLARHARAGVRGEVAALRVPRPWPGLLAHAAAFAATAALGYRLMAPGAPPLGALAFLAWSACVAATVALAVAIVAPPLDVLRVAARHLSAPLLAAAVGLLSWRAVVAADRLWGLLQAPTLAASAALLRTLAADVVLLPAEGVLGAGGFEVHVAPECSGADGVSLVVLFQLVWIALARARIRVGRALLVLPPAGVAAALAANVVRIAILVLVGASGREALAVGTFHSKLGWLLFIAIAFATIAVAEHLPWLAREAPADRAGGLPPAAAGYVAPLLAALVTALLTGLFAEGGLDAWYGARALAAAAALLAFRHALPRPALPLSWVPLAIAAVVSAIWLPFGGAEGSTLGGELARLDPLARTGWLVARLLGGCLILPIVEELAFRGFLLPWLLSSEFERIPARTWSWTAVALSSLAFGALHEQWLLGALAGVLFALARLWRGRLADAVVAHVACNTALGITVLATGRWELWG